MSRNPASTAASAAPIFIGGMFKSGTSLLRAMLGQHSHIASGLETYWFDLDMGARGTPEFDDHVTRIARLFGANIAATRKQAATCASAEDFLERFMANYAKRLGKPRWAEKTPANVAHVARILRHWPRARILHIVRDPRDIYASLVEAKKDGGADAFVTRWRTIMMAAEAERPSAAAGAGSYLEIHYEDLIARTEATMRAVLEFLGEPFQAEAACFSGKSDDYDTVLQVTGKVSTTLERLRRPISDDRVGLWQTALGEAGVAQLMEAADRHDCGALMRQIVAATPR